MQTNLQNGKYENKIRLSLSFSLLLFLLFSFSFGISIIHECLHADERFKVRKRDGIAFSFVEESETAPEADGFTAEGGFEESTEENAEADADALAFEDFQ